MPHNTIAVCSLGDPLSPKTWSGTPYNICQELNNLDRLGATFNSELYANARVRRLVGAGARLYYFNSDDSSRGKIERYLRARQLQTFFRRNNEHDVLHLGTLDLPLTHADKHTRHYLFCDATWHLWSKFSTGMTNYKARLLKDAERLERESYRQMAHIFSISEYVRDNLIAHYDVNPDKVTVIGTGRGAIKPYTGEKDYANGDILFVAKDRFKDKGGELIVEGFKLANKANPRLRLIIVGDDKYKDFIGNTANIEVYGYVTLEQLQDFFNRAALFAMPAHNEPWGLVYLEALSCRTPVMGLNRNALPEITQRGAFGFCLSEETPEAVAATLLEAFDNPARLAEMGRQGQTYCLENFTWERTVGSIVKTIDAVKQSNRG